MYAQLGDIVFESLYGPKSFERKDSVSLPMRNRINLRPRQQFTGIDLATITIGIRLHRAFIDVEDAIERFRTYRNSATHLKFITGSGAVIGTFVISKTTERHDQWTRTGEIVSCELEHVLIEVSSSRTDLTSRNSAIANSNNQPRLAFQPIQPIAPSLPVSAALDVQATMAYANVSSQLIEEYSIAPDDAESKVNQAKKSVVTAREHMADAAAKVQAAQDTAQQAQDYVANMYTVVQNAQTLEQYIDGFDPMDPVGSMNNINNANSEFMSSISVMTNTSSPLAAFTGARR